MSWLFLMVIGFVLTHRGFGLIPVGASFNFAEMFVMAFSFSWMTNLNLLSWQSNLQLALSSTFNNILNLFNLFSVCETVNCFGGVDWLGLLGFVWFMLKGLMFNLIFLLFWLFILCFISFIVWSILSMIAVLYLTEDQLNKIHSIMGLDPVQASAVNMMLFNQFIALKSISLISHENGLGPAMVTSLLIFYGFAKGVFFPAITFIVNWYHLDLIEAGVILYMLYIFPIMMFVFMYLLLLLILLNLFRLWKELWELWKELWKSWSGSGGSSMVMSLGPQHPSTHGVLSLLAVLNGELMQYLSVEMGLLHSGTEKLVESNNYINSIGYFDSLDYVSTVSQEVLFINAMESMINCYEIIYSSSLSTLFLEFYRILNHLLAMTTSIIDLGLFTTMLLMFEEREKLLNFTESLSGTSFHALFMLLGSIRYDVSLKWINSLIDWLMNFLRKLKELYNMTSENSLFHSSLYEMGIISKNFSLYFGISGIMASATGIMLDASMIGYEYYNAIDLIFFFSMLSDGWSRYFMRLMESLQASDIIFTLISLTLNSFILSSSISSSKQSMESVMSHFMYPSSMLDNFPSNFNKHLDSLHFSADVSCKLSLSSLFSSCKMSMESSKGIYSMFMNSMLPFSSSRAFTVNMVCNDFLCVTQLNKICRSINLADLIAVLGSVDFVLGSVDLYVDIMMLNLIFPFPLYILDSSFLFSSLVSFLLPKLVLINIFSSSFLFSAFFLSFLLPKLVLILVLINLNNCMFPVPRRSEERQKSEWERLKEVGTDLYVPYEVLREWRAAAEARLIASQMSDWEGPLPPTHEEMHCSHMGSKSGDRVYINGKLVKSGGDMTVTPAEYASIYEESGS